MVIYSVETRETAKHPIMHSIEPTTKNYLTQNVSSIADTHTHTHTCREKVYKEYFRITIVIFGCKMNFFP